MKKTRDVGMAEAEGAVEDGEGRDWIHHLVHRCQRLPLLLPPLMWIRCRATARMSQERAGYGSAAS